MKSFAYEGFLIFCTQGCFTWEFFINGRREKNKVNFLAPSTPCSEPCSQIKGLLEIRGLLSLLRIECGV